MLIYWNFLHAVEPTRQGYNTVILIKYQPFLKNIKPKPTEKSVFSPDTGNDVITETNSAKLIVVLIVPLTIHGSYLLIITRFIEIGCIC